MWNLLAGAEGGGGGGGWVLKKALDAEAPPRGPAPPFHIPFLTGKGTSLVYFLLTNGTRFTYLV